MSFATDSEIHPVYGDELEIKVTDTDAGLTPGTELTNEQWFIQIRIRYLYQPAIKRL